MDEQDIEAVWQKGRGMPGRDQTLWRQDQCGAWLRRDHYGSTTSQFGWTALRTAPGGGNSPEDFRPFHWKNSFDIALGEAICRVTADRAGVPAGQRIVDEPRNMDT